MKNTLFIVTSAIMAGNGNPKERFLQTLHTIDSIKVRFPSAKILLCDSSSTEIEGWMKTYLTSVELVEFYRHDRIHQIRDEVKHFNLPVTESVRSFYELGALKNLTESYVINNILSTVDLTNYNRVFKLSGRYFLTQHFNPKRHDINGKIVLKPKVRSELGMRYAGSEWYIHCISWNFCTSIIPEISQSFLQIEDYIVNRFKNGLLADIEHGLSLYVPDHLIHEIEFNGIIGRMNNDAITKD